MYFHLQSFSMSSSSHLHRSPSSSRLSIASLRPLQPSRPALTSCHPLFFLIAPAPPSHPPSASPAPSSRFSVSPPYHPLPAERPRHPILSHLHPISPHPPLVLHLVPSSPPSLPSIHLSPLDLLAPHRTVPYHHRSTLPLVLICSHSFLSSCHCLRL